MSTHPLTELITRLLNSEALKEQVCKHFDQVQAVTPATPDGCQECLEMGDPWFHLRICLTCGHVGCCDASKNKHATAHYEATGHPMIMSFQPGEDWLWCYPDVEAFFP